MWRVLVMLCVLAGGCRREQPLLRFDDDLVQQITRRTTAAAENLSVSSASDPLWDGIAANPDLVAQGEALLGALSNDPKVVGPFTTLFEAIAEAPEIQAAVARVVEEHPDATPEQIDELFGQRYEQAFQSPAVMRVWRSTANAFIARLRAHEAMGALRALLDGRISMPVISSELMKKWNARLTELAGGTRPATAKAAEIYLRHAWSDERIERFVRELSTNAVIHKQLAKAIAEALAVPSVRADLQAAVITIITDAAIRDRLLELFVTFSLSPPPADRVQTALEGLLMTPVMVDTTAKLLVSLVTKPEVIAIFERRYEQVRTDPSVRAAFASFFVDW